MVRRASRRAHAREVSRKTSERSSIRQQDGEMEETQPTASRDRDGSLLLVQLEKHDIGVVRAERRGALRLRHDRKTEEVAIVAKGAIEIRHLQPRRPEPRRVRHLRSRHHPSHSVMPGIACCSADRMSASSTGLVTPPHSSRPPGSARLST
jgi:hypothetical protein